LRFYIRELLGYKFGSVAEKILLIFVKTFKYVEQVEGIYIENLETFKLLTNNVLPNRNVFGVFRMKTPDFILIVFEVLGSQGQDVRNIYLLGFIKIGLCFFYQLITFLKFMAIKA
jgi:hypothetical protein